MAKLNRTCAICHKKYSYCPTCASDINRPTWLAVFCEENCRDLYNVINDYRYKLLSKKEAVCKLNSLDLSCKKELPENFKMILEDILRNEDKLKETIEETIEEIIEEKIELEKVSIKSDIDLVKEKQNEEITKFDTINNTSYDGIKKPKKKKVRSVE